MRPVIVSEKHYVQHPIATVVAGAIGINTVVRGVTVVAKGANTFEVEEGSVVKAVYVELWFTGVGDDGVLQTTIEKVPNGGVNMTAAQAAALNSYPNKKNILESHQGLLPNATQNPVRFYGHWIKIPKGKQRFGLGDELVVNIAPLNANGNFCGLETYKEYK